MALLDKTCPEAYYPIYETKRISEVHRAYTSVEPLDQTLCMLVSFFVQAMKPKEYPTTLALLTAFPAVAVFPFVESARTRSSGGYIPSFGPMIVGLVFQRFGGGAILPLYWIFLLLSGRFDNKSNKQVPQRQAFAILLGLVAGYYLPTYAMFSTTKITWIAFWQAFPLYMMIAQFAGLLIVPKTAGRSGARIIQLIYMTTFIVGAVFHLSALSQIKSNPSISISSVFLPSFQPIMEDSPSRVAQNFLQWDYVFIFSSAAILTLRLANNVQQMFALLAAHLALSVNFGAGSAFAAVMIWREQKMLNKSNI